MARLPQKISGYRSGVINGILQYLEEGIIAESSDHRIEKTPTGVVLHNIDKPQDILDFPFKLFADGKTIRVTQGSWTRNGTKVSLAPDTDKTFYSITDPVGADTEFQADTTYSVYLGLSSSTRDAALQPDAVNVYAGESMPTDEPSSGNYYWLLGTVYCDDNSKLYQPNQVWTGGDIDDVSYICDADSTIDSDPDFRYHSIEMSPRDDTHYGTLQLYDWDDQTPQTPVAGDLFMFQDVNTDDNKYLRYVALEDLSTAIGDNIDPDTDLTAGEESQQRSLEKRTIGALGEAWQIYKMDEAAEGIPEDGLDLCARYTSAGVNAVRWVNTTDLVSYLEVNMYASEPPSHNIRQHTDYAGAYVSPAAIPENYVAAGAGSDTWEFVTITSLLSAAGGWSGTFQVTQDGLTKDVTVENGIITDVA